MISAVLALSLLAGCGSARVDSEPDPVEGVLPGEELGVSDAADEIFSLNYNSSARWTDTGRSKLHLRSHRK